MSRVVYEVRAEVPVDLAQRYERWMREEHIPAVLATGCFTGARLERTGEHTFRTRYAAATLADLDRYLSRHTATLREAFAREFPAGITVAREVWTEAQAWP